MKGVACRFTFKWNQFNPLQPGVAYLYPLKTFRFFDVFRGYR